MHNCSVTQERIADLLFDELEMAEKESLLAEIEICADCRSEYQAMNVTLRVFDKAAELQQPAESYWPGYEMQLRERLAQADQNLWQRFAGWLADVRFTMPVPAMATATIIVLLSAGVFWWLAKQNPTAGDPVVRLATPSPAITPSPSAVPATTPEIAPPEKTAGTPQRNFVVAEKNRNAVPDRNKSARQPRNIQVPSVPEMSEPDNLIGANFEPAEFAGGFFDPLTTHHLEKTQLTLRAFRNLSAGRTRADLRYEKKSSRSLLHRNILLRREAEASGNLPAQELLGTLEPLLIDIANLPDRASADELRSVRERIERQEIIATLQIYTTRLTASAGY